MKINEMPGSSVDEGLMFYLKQLNLEVLTKLQKKVIAIRERKRTASQFGSPPEYRNESDVDWKAELPEWMQDQRNQMTGPADNGELVVKLLNSGSPGVMLDLEDSMANQPENLKAGILNIQDAIHGELTYIKNGKEHSIKDSNTVIFSRVRGLHMTQRVEGHGDIPASLFDLAAIAYNVDISKLKHPLCFYIPKSEVAEEAIWWKLAFEEIEKSLQVEHGWIKAMALVEAHPMAYEMEEFSRLLQPYLVGLNLGRWDYMASLIDYMFYDDKFLFPDRNEIPTEIPFFQNLRHRMAYVCHKHGMLAIGGMTALYPSRTNAVLNKLALDILDRDKKNEAACFMDGAWTGHPDQNEIALRAFPEPNQLDKMPHKKYYKPDLRKFPKRSLKTTGEGTREAIRVVIQYRHGVLLGKGAVLINGYMEDLATDRIYRLIIAQRYYRTKMTRAHLDKMFKEEAEKLGSEYANAAEVSKQLIIDKEFNPV